MLEIELKVRVNSLDPIRQNLKNRHAEFRGKQHEHDIYYNAPHRDFGSTDEALRVRYTKDHALITYKGKKLRELRAQGTRRGSIQPLNPGRFLNRSLPASGLQRPQKSTSGGRITGSKMHRLRWIWLTVSAHLSRSRLLPKTMMQMQQNRFRGMQKRWGSVASLSSPLILN